MSENGVQGFLGFAGRASEHSPGLENQRPACSPCAAPWLEPWDPLLVLELGQERCECGGMGGRVTSLSTWERPARLTAWPPRSSPLPPPSLAVGGEMGT